MARSVSVFRWYWFLEWHAVLGAALTVAGVAFSLLEPRFTAFISFCTVLLIGAASIYRERLFRRLGADRISAPAWFQVFWLFIVLVDIVLFALL